MEDNSEAPSWRSTLKLQSKITSRRCEAKAVQSKSGLAQSAAHSESSVQAIVVAV